MLSKARNYTERKEVSLLQELSTEESIEQIAQNFAHISQGYPPLDALPQCVRDILMMYVNKLKNRKN